MHCITEQAVSAIFNLVAHRINFRIRRRHQLSRAHSNSVCPPLLVRICENDGPYPSTPLVGSRLFEQLLDLALHDVSLTHGKFKSDGHIDETGN